MTIARARGWRYLLRYQLPDFLVSRAGLPVLAAVMIGVMVYYTAGAGIEWQSEDGERLAQQVFSTLIGVVITLGAFMGVAKLTTDDRANGWYRSYFSKPVKRTTFYAKQWALHGVTLVLLVGVLGMAWQLATNSVSVKEAMVVTALTWIMLGGVGFLLSVLTNQDAGLLFIAYVLSMVLHSVKDQRNSPMWGWLREVTRLTLPTQKLEYVKDLLYAGQPIPWGHAGFVIGYGAVAFVIGVILLRRLSLAR